MKIASIAIALMFAQALTLLGQKIDSLSEILEDVSEVCDGSLRVAKDKAHMAILSKSLKYRSLQLEKEHIFTGKYTLPALAPEKSGRYFYGMAIFSDDGCNVTVNGKRVHQRLGVLQHLPGMAVSFAELPVLLAPGTEVTITVSYANSLYFSEYKPPMEWPDIDGCTLFVYRVPLEMRITDRDDPKKKWSDNALRTAPVYSGKSCGDMVSWKLGATGSWTNASFSWSAEGPENKTGPSGTGVNEWLIADGDHDTTNDWLKWKPGKYKIKCTLSSGVESSSTVEFEQEVGVRTEEYFVVGSLLAEPTVPTTGVDASTFDHFECPEIAFRLLFQDFNDPTDAEYVPEKMEDRIYVNYRIVNSTANISPLGDVDPEKTADDAFGLSGDVHYRFFSRCQFKYLLDDNRKLKAPPVEVGNLVDLAGETPAPCGLGYIAAPDLNGVRHADSGKMFATVGADEFYYLTKIRAGKSGQDGFEELNRRELPWVFVKFRFNMEDGELKTKFSAGASGDPDGPDAKDYSPVPTIFMFRRYWENSKFNVENTDKCDQKLMDFLNIGKIKGTPHYR